MDYEPSPELLRYYAGDDPVEQLLVRTELVSSYEEWSRVYPPGTLLFYDGDEGRWRTIQGYDRPEPEEHGSALGMAAVLAVQGMIWFCIGLLVGMLVWK